MTPARRRDDAGVSARSQRPEGGPCDPGSRPMTLSAADARAGGGAGCEARRVVLRRMLTDLIADGIGSPGEGRSDPVDDPAPFLLDLLVEWGVVEPAGGSRRGECVQREPLPSHLMFPTARPRLIPGTKPAG